jgi:1-acyl-sn-glycerol-3-phosphate acyltransferase
LRTLILIYRWVIALLTIFVSGTIGLSIVLLSFGYARNFLAQHYFNHVSIFILRLMGYRALIPRREEFPSEPVFYTFNHNSNLDIFLLTALGLSNVRYLVSEKTLKYLPIIFSVKGVGGHYIPQQHHRKRRLKFFKKTSRFLQHNSHLSMFGSAEGVHPHRHAIAPFNRGVFHLAMAAKRKIVLLYIHMPKDVVAKKLKDAKGGNLQLEVLKEVDTSNWQLNELDKNIAEIRAVYVNRFNTLNPNEITE